MRNSGQSSAQIIVVARSKLDCAFALDRLGTVTWRYCWQVWVSAACLTAPPGWPGVAVYVVKLAGAGFLLAVFETAIAKMRVFRVPDFLGIALMLGLLGMLLLFVSRSF